jgi:hypothetical protein
MFSRNWLRSIAAVTLCACAPMFVGCATTNRFVVDPDLTASFHVEAIEISGTDEGTSALKTRFDAAGGQLDLASMTVRGTTRDGETVAVPLAEVRRFHFQDDREPGHSIKANPAALVAGSRWQPDGQIQYVALRTGEIRDVRQVATTLDQQDRAVICVAADGIPEAIPFDQIVYVQIKDSHPGRTFVAVIGGAGLALVIAFAIVLATSDFSIGSSN